MKTTKSTSIILVPFHRSFFYLCGTGGYTMASWAREDDITFSLSSSYKWHISEVAVVPTIVSLLHCAIKFCEPKNERNLLCVYFKRIPFGGCITGGKKYISAHTQALEYVSGILKLYFVYCNFRVFSLKAFNKKQGENSCFEQYTQERMNYTHMARSLYMNVLAACGKCPYLRRLAEFLNSMSRFYCHQHYGSSPQKHENSARIIIIHFITNRVT